MNDIRRLDVKKYKNQIIKSSICTVVLLGYVLLGCNIYTDSIHINNMKANYQIALEDIENKESKISNLTNTNNIQSEKIDDLSKSITDLNNQVESLHKDLDNKNTEIDHLNNQISKKANNTKEMVAQTNTNQKETNVNTSNGTAKVFRITFYSGDSATASGAIPTAYHTCATGSGYPFGTKIYVPSIGTLTVEDRGNPSVVTNNVIDVFVNGTESELMQMGTRNETCYILN